MAKVTPKISPAKRGEVTKNYRKVKALAGFMDDGHFRGFAQEHLLSLPKAKQDALLEEAEQARAAATQLPAHSDFTAEIRPLQASAYEDIVKDETFQTVFGSRPYRFAWVKPENLLALQGFVNTQAENVPSEEKALMEFAFPSDWKVPAEISFMPPMGPIYIVSSSPQMVGYRFRWITKRVK